MPDFYVRLIEDEGIAEEPDLVEAASLVA